MTKDLRPAGYEPNAGVRPLAGQAIAMETRRRRPRTDAEAAGHEDDGPPQVPEGQLQIEDKSR